MLNIPALYKKKYPNRKKPPRIPRPLFPLAAERLFLKEMTALIMKSQEAFRRIVKPRLQGYAAEFRQDDVNDDIEFYINEFNRIQDDIWNEREINRVAKDMVVSVDKHNLVQINKQFRALAGVEIAGFEPWVPLYANNQVKATVNKMREVSDSIKASVYNRVIEGGRNGLRWEEIVASIESELNGRKGIFKTVRNRAELIARTEVAQYNSALTRKRMTDNGLQKYDWVTAGDERVRESHRALNGTTHSWDKPTGEGFPGQAIRCRCVAVATTEELLDFSSIPEAS